MKSYVSLVLATAATVSAQVTINDGNYTCAIADATYCAGDSMDTNIIIRCDGFVGQPGNCDDNMDGEPPQGLYYSPCYQTSETSGDAACTKNCIIYGGTEDFSSVPNCEPTYTASSSSVASTSSSTATSVPSSESSSTVVTITDSETTTVPCTTSTSSGGAVSSSVTTVPTTETVPTSSASVPFYPNGTSTTVVTAPAGSGGPSTITISTAVTSPEPSSVSSATASSSVVAASGAGAVAVAGQAGSIIAILGMAIAYFL